MRVLGLMGSPRKQGNTDLLLDEALKGAHSAGAQVEKLVLNELHITPCQEHYACLKAGECDIKDDMVWVYSKLVEADVLILASPIFFYGLTAQAKALIDRCQALWVRKYRLKRTTAPGRRGAFIGVGATKGRKLFEGAVLTVGYFFDAADVAYSGELLIRGVDKKGEIRQHPTALKEAFDLGKRLAQS